MRTNPPRRRLARWLFWLAGQLSRVKTPTYTYEVVSWGPPMETVRSESWSWHPCGWSMDVLRWSMRLDGVHWGHWALMHEDCDPVVCAVCGGLICSGDEG